MALRSIRIAPNLTGKKVLLRVDFNVPLKNGKIIEDYKIVQCLATIRYLLRYKSKLTIATHLGNPQGKKVKGLSTAPVAKRLAELLGEKVTFMPEAIGEKVRKAINGEKGDKEIIFLENLRYYPGEEKNSRTFAKKLAKPFDLCVNNAFAVCHREHASVAAIKKYLPVYAGLLLEEEMINLIKAMQPKKPLVIVIGGSKIQTKLPLIKNFLKRADHILIGGAIANDFIKGLGYQVGKSLVGKDTAELRQAIKIYRRAGNKKIILPADFVVSDRLDERGKAEIKSINNIDHKDYILDIGPKSISFYAKYIKAANTLIWNGPMGMFELNDFRHGTMAIARLIAARSTGQAFGVVGGGETVEALRKTQMIQHVDWVSTGGGAMLDFLAGQKLPGLKGIIKR